MSRFVTIPAGALALVFLVPMGASFADTVDEPERIATEYLRALAGSGDDKARGYLLGGVPLAAKDYKIPNWKIIEREPVRVEEKSTREVLFRLRVLDDKGRRALAQLTKASAKTATNVDRDQARALLDATREDARGFITDFPVFAAVARADKDVFWHPNNPWRALITELEKSKTMRVEYHLFRIEERDADRAPRVWPLRVVKITGDAGYDSGHRILPASHWDPEY